jgi:HSP20 family protein
VLVCVKILQKKAENHTFKTKIEGTNTLGTILAYISVSTKRSRNTCRKGAGSLNRIFLQIIPLDMEKTMKTITLYRPSSIQNIMNEFGTCFESLDSLLPPVTRMFNQTPVVDIHENDDAYVLEMELPGYDEKNIDVHLDGTNLTIASRQETQTENKINETQKAYLIKERRTSSFSRSFKLPQNANPEAVSAVFKNGVLSLEIKKQTESQKKTIMINAA